MVKLADQYREARSVSEALLSFQRTSDRVKIAEGKVQTGLLIPSQIMTAAEEVCM